MPSHKHTDLIRRSLIWLSNIATQRGIRGCAEIPLDDGYVADAVAICGLQSKWDLKFFGKYYGTICNERGWITTDDFSFIFEAKASRSDFNKTFIHAGNHLGDRMIPRGNFHFVVAAKNILPSSDCVPMFWGLLEESRTGLKVVKMPEFVPQPLHNLHEIGYRIMRYTKHGKFSDYDLRVELEARAKNESQTDIEFPSEFNCSS